MGIMKNLYLVVVVGLLMLIGSQTFAVCVDYNLEDASGTSQFDYLYFDAVPMAAPPNLSAQEQELYPYLLKLIGDLRGEDAARKVISHFDHNHDGVLTSNELDEGFKRPPFEFGFVGRKVGIPILLNQYGDENGISIEGSRRFVQKYGF